MLLDISKEESTKVQISGHPKQNFEYVIRDNKNLFLCQISDLRDK